MMDETCRSMLSYKVGQKEGTSERLARAPIFCPDCDEPTLIARPTGVADIARTSQLDSTSVGA